MRLLRAGRSAANRILGTAAMAKHVLRDAVVIFLYHDVTDHPSEFNASLDLNVSPRVFADQLDLIADSFHVIRPEELVSGDHPTPAAMITFDDGNAGYFHKAVPIMRAKSIPSVCFVNMATIDGDLCWAGLVTYLARHEPAFSRDTLGKPFSRITDADVAALLPHREFDRIADRARRFRGAIGSREDLVAVAHEPLVSLGNHLYNHRNAATLSVSRLRTEFSENQVLIDAHPRGTRLFSYPFGEPGTCLNAMTTDVLLQEGAARLFTAFSLPNERWQILYHRVAMFEAVRTREQMYRAIMQNYLRAKLGMARPARLH